MTTETVLSQSEAHEITMKFTFKNKTLERKDIQDDDFAEILEAVSPYCMAMEVGSVEVLYSLYANVRHVISRNIPGDIVECGVWQGGMILLAALTLKTFGDESRRLYLYDTFSGMPKPGDEDIDWDGNAALNAWHHWNKKETPWGFGGTVDEVRQLVGLSGYPPEKFVFVEGMVEDTIPNTVPEKISLLRLDTDLYQSTYHELVHLYPRLSVGGFLIIDDYGFYQGARKATDQYIAEYNPDIFLARIHWSVRMGVKTS